MDRADRRRLGAALAAALVLVAAPIRVLAVTPIDSGWVTGITPVDINTTAGSNQFDPHVNGDLAAYTSANTIRYYNFGTGDDFGVPTAPDTADQLSDVSNGRIVFSRLDFNTGDISIQVFDTMTAVTTPIGQVADTVRSNGAIGSDTVAFIDSTSGIGDLWASEIGGSPVQITSDARTDQQPQVAPLGDLIVYESCQTDANNCNVRQAGWNGSGWVVTSLTNNSEPEANPDSDGVIVVYDAIRSGERDIYWQNAGGDTEQNLALAGEQRNPSISAGVIAFESVAVGDTAADLYAYQLASNRLFRVTSTPSNETLNDVYVLNDGRVRMVWSSGSLGDLNVYGATFEISSVDPGYSFGGFQAPVEPMPTLNSLRSGAAVPVKFSLGGDHGLAIFAAGYPKSQSIACDPTGEVEGVDQTVSAGASSLTYDTLTGTYLYVWKTDKAWKGTCRQLVLGFADGSFERATFMFK
jgi:hypothetical protein